MFAYSLGPVTASICSSMETGNTINFFQKIEAKQTIYNNEAGGAYIKSNWVTNLTRISKSPTGLYVNIIVTRH